MGLDFLVVGAGLFGATCARRLADAGKRCLVIDKRSHVAGNCHTEWMNGFLVHGYGPHYFHTNDERVWAWVNRFGTWRTYVPRVKARAGGRVLSLPVNLMTLNQLWGVNTPEEALRVLEEKRLTVPGNDAESQLLRTVGWELYELLFRGYTRKQWGMDPSELPASVVSRLPVRMTYDDSYHTAKYQAVPEDGYTALVEAMLEGIPVELETPYEGQLAKHTVYTGPLDTLYGYRYGKLDYRSLRFERELLSCDDHQGCAQMNYPDEGVPFTRVVEHRHIHGSRLPGTVITREYPATDGEPYYPVPTDENLKRARAYRQLAEAGGFFVGGRLGLYKYLDMDGAIAAALKLTDGLLS